MLDAGKVVEVLDPDFVNDFSGKMVPITYTLGSDRFEGRVADFSLDRNVESEFAPEEPFDFPNEGRHRVDVKKGQKFQVAMDEYKPLTEELTFDADKNIMVVVLDDMTAGTGRCQIQYNGRNYYARLRAVFPR